MIDPSDWLLTFIGANWIVVAGLEVTNAGNTGIGICGRS
jgi:hypothetical protein